MHVVIFMFIISYWLMWWWRLNTHDLPSISRDPESRWCGSKAWEPDGWCWRCSLKFEALSTKSAEHRRRSMSLLNQQPPWAPCFFGIWALCGLGGVYPHWRGQCTLLTVFPAPPRPHTLAAPWAGRILVLRPRIKLPPPELEVQSLNHWTTREVPTQSIDLVVNLFQ